MAELATIARPYAEALIAAGADQAAVTQVAALAAVAADAEVQQFAGHPKVTGQQVHELVAGLAGRQQAMGTTALNLLQAVVDNGRLAALPEIALQAQALLNQRSGVSQALVQSAFPMDAAQLGEIQPVLEQRFGRKLEIVVEVDANLIGGIRAVVGDEVFDTSVRARLERMRLALTA
ncbi:F0F1 ATP synthase subunit delta [Aquabacterium sp. OR-4]|uniref:F0F1 ATP synthase subunit delta n=1 Tax=Aquabacterium sp. OR-4 TaxID=2978127 RepID=UPI0021B1D5F2|nr:F0F1 ATP synthase subunit delta [Aquabacterium sp. OR-4]MDT7837771.1 F0F1 ATP synthase subunit delta [Aquabacterium sp. OR-4]